MKEANKDKQTSNTEEKADNPSVYSKPTIQQKTEQGEADTDESRVEGHKYNTQLPAREPGEKTTDGVDKV
jgi:hypothetical protein